jgi:hypothetical protein
MNKNTHYTQAEKEYITNNADKTPAEIATHIERPKNSIKVYMSKKGLLKKRLPFEFNKKNEEYIINHFNSKPLTDIAAEINENYFKVYAFCVRKGLIYPKENKKMIPAYSADKKTVYNRPPAKYSNPDYSTMYL